MRGPLARASVTRRRLTADADTGDPQQDIDRAKPLYNHTRARRERDRDKARLIDLQLNRAAGFRHVIHRRADAIERCRDCRPTQLFRNPAAAVGLGRYLLMWLHVGIDLKRGGVVVAVLLATPLVLAAADEPKNRLMVEIATESLRADDAPHQPASTSPSVIDQGHVEAVLGKEVVSSLGEKMGRIIDILVDRNGRVRGAVIDFGGFLGVGVRKIVVDWRDLHFSPSEHTSRISVDLTRDQVKAAPEFQEGKPVVVVGAPAMTTSGTSDNPEQAPSAPAPPSSRDQVSAPPAAAHSPAMPPRGSSVGHRSHHQACKTATHHQCPRNRTKRCQTTRGTEHNRLFFPTAAKCRPAARS